MQCDTFFFKVNNFQQKMKHAQELKHIKIFKTSVSKCYVSSYPVIHVTHFSWSSYLTTI